MIRNQLKDLIKRFIPTKVDFSIEIPEEKTHGDYATNIALVLSKELKKNPVDAAKSLVSKFEIRNSKFLNKVEVVKPGFINFFLKPEFLQEQVKDILSKKEKFGEINIGKNKKIQVEFVSSNPTGPLTVANARGGPMGDVLANVLQAAGYKAEKEFYVNDSGMQILSLGHSVLKDKKARYKGKYIDELSKRIKEKDPYKAGQKAAKIIIKEMIRKTTDKLGIKYDKWFFESSLDVEKIIKLLKNKKLLYEKDGATWFKSSKFGDNRDRVLIKQDGGYTYLAGDIAYHYNKFSTRGFDKVINIWGADHHGDVSGLQAGIKAIGIKNRLDIILYQFVNFLEKGKQVRMSKRKGVFVEASELLDEVGADVLRFFFLMYSFNRHIEFNLDLAREKSEKNPVYYVQYAHARICSILRKSQIASTKLQTNVKFQKLNTKQELELIKELIKLPEIIEDIAEDYQVQRLPYYALNIAAAFHRFYTNCRVLGEEKELKKARLSLILATKIVLKNIFDLMGLNAPEKM